jgi:hypothetical protein
MPLFPSCIEQMTRVFFFYRKRFSLCSTVDTSSEVVDYNSDFSSEEAAGEDLHFGHRFECWRNMKNLWWPNICGGQCPPVVQKIFP